MEQSKRVRLNQEYRNKIAKRIELGLDQESTIEKEKYLQLREQIKPLQDKTWAMMYEILLHQIVAFMLLMKQQGQKINLTTMVMLKKLKAH
jgi:hypothetical protein